MSAVRIAVLWAGSRPRQSEHVSGRSHSLASLSLLEQAFVRQQVALMALPVWSLFTMPGVCILAAHVNGLPGDGSVHVQHVEQYTFKGLFRWEVLQSLGAAAPVGVAL